MTLEKEIEDILQLNQKGIDIIQEARVKQRQLQNKLKNGEISSGKKARDFVLVLFGVSDEAQKTEQPYIELADKINRNTGKKVLVKYEEEVLGSSVVPKPYWDRTSLDVGIKSLLRMGVISDKIDFNLQEAEIIIPTKNYVEKTDRYRSDWNLKEGNLILPGREIISLDKKVEMKETPIVSIVDIQYGLQIYVGEEVAKYFNPGKTISSEYMKALELLKVKIPRELRLKYEIQNIR